MKRSDWINIKRELPKHGEVVLVCTTKNRRITATYHKYFTRFIDFESEVELHVKEITHWMPLPKLPLEGKQLSLFENEEDNS